MYHIVGELHKPVYVYLVLHCCSWGEAGGAASLCEMRMMSLKRKEVYHLGGVPYYYVTKKMGNTQ